MNSWGRKKIAGSPRNGALHRNKPSINEVRTTATIFPVFSRMPLTPIPAPVLASACAHLASWAIQPWLGMWLGPGQYLLNIRLALDRPGVSHTAGSPEAWMWSLTTSALSGWELIFKVTSECHVFLPSSDRSARWLGTAPAGFFICIVWQNHSILPPDESGGLE